MKIIPDSSASSSNGKRDARMRITAVSLSLIVGILLMAAKFYIYRITQSTAILSDALESIINVVASAFALGSILLAAVPPDANHPYGHGKIEYFSAGFEGALIMLAAIGIFKTGWPRIFEPTALPNLQEGLWMLLGASLVNLALGVGLIRSGRKTRSLTLIADGKHVLTDVYTSAGVIVGLFLVNMTGWFWMDGAVACMVGLNILYTGGVLLYQSFAGLMNASDPKLLQEICGLLDNNRKESWIDVHRLRAWTSGNLVHIDFHLILPRSFSLEDAHSEAKALEIILCNHFNGNAGVLIHLDPCIEPNCPVCAKYLCEDRVLPLAEQTIWSVENTTKKGWEEDWLAVHPPLNKS
jgi:cation diffusion facilitator family transporter